MPEGAITRLLKSEPDGCIFDDRIELKPARRRGRLKAVEREFGINYTLRVVPGQGLLRRADVRGTRRRNAVGLGRPGDRLQ